MSERQLIPNSIAVNRSKLKDAFSGAYARGLKNSHAVLTVTAFISFVVLCILHFFVGSPGNYSAVNNAQENKAVMDMAVFITIAVIAAVNIVFLVVISLALRKSYNYFCSKEYDESQAYERIFKENTLRYDPRKLSMQVRIYACIKTITALFAAVLFTADAIAAWRFAGDAHHIFTAILSSAAAAAVLIFCITAAAVCIFEGKAWENFADVYDGINTVSDVKIFLKCVKAERICLFILICLSGVSIIYSVNILTLPFLCVFFYYDKLRISVAKKFIDVFGGINAELIEQV